MRHSALLLLLLALPLVPACGGGNAVSPGAPPTPAASTAAPTPVTTPPGATTTPPPGAPLGAVDNTVSDSPAAIAQKYGGATVTPDQRAQALAEIGARVTSLAGQPPQARDAALVAFLQARPEIEAAGATPGLSVWARFKDGKSIVIPTYDLAPKGAPHASLDVPRASAKAKEEPEPKRAHAFDTFSYYPPLIRELPGWLGDDGYVVDPSSVTGTIEALKAIVHGDGFFYINTHGAPGFERKSSIFGDHAELYALETSTAVRDVSGRPIRDRVGGEIYDMDKTASAYEDDLSDGSLVYMFAAVRYTDKDTDKPVGERPWDVEWRYGFTHRFVHKYMDFGKDSFVFLNACSSVSPMAAAMDAELVAKHAGTIVGWTAPIERDTAIKAGELLLDRMLGANKSTKVTPSKPRQRPWDLQAAYAEIVAKKLDHFENDPAKLAVYPEGADPILTPSIQYLDVDEKEKTLTLHGAFGSDPGDAARSVTIGAADCPVKDWAVDTVHCDLGDDFKVGDVVAKARDRKSNAVPLTGWKLHVDYDMPFPKDVPGNFGMGFALEVHLRADVHRYRLKPDEPQGAPRQPFAIVAAHDSVCKTKDEGHYAAQGGFVSLGGGGAPLPVAYGAPDPTGSCFLFGTIDPEAKKISLAMLAFSRGAGQVDGTDMAAQGIGFAMMPVPGLFDGTMPLPAIPDAPPFPKVDLKLGTDWTIAGDSRGPVAPAEAPKLKVSLKWTAAPADHPPTDDTAQ